MGNRYIDAVTITADTNHATVRNWNGFSIREAAGTPAQATVRFRDGAVGGDILGVLELAGDESASMTLTDDLKAPSGIYVEVVSGTIEGVLYRRI